MARQIISVFVFTLFFSKALTLMCYNCTAPYSSCQQKNCSSSTQCLSQITYSDGLRDCANYTSVNWSVNIGRFRYSVKYCSSDLCNNATDSTNEKSCYTCSGTDCSQTMSCKGDETQCITATGAINATLKGCASQTVCASITLAENVLSKYGYGNTSLSCCDGNLCNTGTILTQGAVLLLIPVLFLLFFI